MGKFFVIRTEAGQSTCSPAFGNRGDADTEAKRQKGGFPLSEVEIAETLAHVIKSPDPFTIVEEKRR